MFIKLSYTFNCYLVCLLNEFLHTRYTLTVRYEKISASNLLSYAELFKVSFLTTKLSVSYLDWLYFRNPLGNVIGYDAFFKDKLVAHYACIPTSVDGVSGLLSLNTATHPEFRGKGLHSILANMTYEESKPKFDFVIGVANQNSVTNFLNKLGFINLGNLNLRWGKLTRQGKGVKRWTKEELAWRVNSPRSNFRVKLGSNGLAQFVLKPTRLPVLLKSNVTVQSDEFNDSRNERISEIGLTLDWNAGSKPKIFLPNKFKPSPLILIYKSLNLNKVDITSFSFPDFDAF